MPDYIPTSDADFDNWLGLFGAYITASAADASSLTATMPVT